MAIVSQARVATAGGSAGLAEPGKSPDDGAGAPVGTGLCAARRAALQRAGVEVLRGGGAHAGRAVGVGGVRYHLATWAPTGGGGGGGGGKGSDGKGRQNPWCRRGSSVAGLPDARAPCSRY